MRKRRRMGEGRMAGNVMRDESYIIFNFTVEYIFVLRSM